jgi:hypothetical protein
MDRAIAAKLASPYSRKRDNSLLIPIHHFVLQYVHISSRGKTAYAIVADECPDAQCDIDHLGTPLPLLCRLTRRWEID